MKRSLWVLPLIAVAAAGFAQTASDQRRKAEEERMKKLEKAYTDAKTAFTRNPNNATLKKRYVDATVTFGTFTMNTFLFPPMQKYPPRPPAIPRGVAPRPPKPRSPCE